MSEPLSFLRKIAGLPGFNLAGKTLLVAILYFLFGKLAFLLSVSNGIVTNVPFFAEGISLGFTIIFG